MRLVVVRYGGDAAGRAGSAGPGGPAASSRPSHGAGGRLGSARVPAELMTVAG